MRFGLYAYPVHGKRQTRAAQGLEKAIRGFANDIDVFVAPEYANVGFEEAPRLNILFNNSKEPSSNLLIPGSVIVSESLGQNPTELFNRAYVFDALGFRYFDQKKHCFIEGMSPYDHSIGKSGNMVLGSGNVLPVFTHCGKKFALDICIDNSTKNGPPVLDGQTGIDYHIIIASGMGVPEITRGRYTLFLEGGGQYGNGTPIPPFAAVWQESEQNKISPSRRIGIGVEKASTGKSLDILYIFDLP